MRTAVPFRPLPGVSDQTPRPVVDVFVDGIEVTGLHCLIDSGSLHNRFAAWVAREAGLDLRRAPEGRVGIGGQKVRTRTVPVRLSFSGHTWEAPVSFCDPWPWDFHVLGQEGFLRWFVVTLDAADRSMRIEPAT